MPKKYWLFKSEPESFSIDDLARSQSQTTSWQGVRNYQSRNLLRDQVQIGDEVFFHHSSTVLLGIAGTCVVVRAGCPDESAFDRESDYFDVKSVRETPRWYTVGVKLIEKFPDIIPLSMLKETPGLEKMMVCKRGARLSIQPVTADEWTVVTNLAAQLFGKRR